MLRKTGLFIIPFLLMLAGCAQTIIWTSNPAVQTSDSQHFQIQLEPIKDINNFYVWFRLSVINKTDKDLEIDWNKTRYLFNGRTMGVFVFEGINPEDVKNMTISPEVIPGGTTFSKEIAPFKLVAWAPLRDQSVPIGKNRINPGLIPAGENGIYLVARQNGETLHESITVRIEESMAQ
ncbi:hypothetical protein ACFL7E_04100 [Thermodesulfobacteriota bacterium]